MVAPSYFCYYIVLQGIYWYTPPGSQITQYEMISGGAHALGPGVSVGCGVLCEIILTTFLVMAVLMTAVDRVAGKPFAAIIIGLSVAVDIMVGYVKMGHILLERVRVHI